MSTLLVAFEDFILSREAMLCSPQTIDFYRRMLRPFLALADGSQPSNRMVRESLSTVAQRVASSATVQAPGSPLGLANEPGPAAPISETPQPVPIQAPLRAVRHRAGQLQDLRRGLAGHPPLPQALPGLQAARGLLGQRAEFNGGMLAYVVVERAGVPMLTHRGILLGWASTSRMAPVRSGR